MIPLRVNFDISWFLIVFLKKIKTSMWVHNFPLELVRYWCLLVVDSVQSIPGVSEYLWYQFTCRTLSSRQSATRLIPRLWGPYQVNPWEIASSVPRVTC